MLKKSAFLAVCVALVIAIPTVAKAQTELPKYSRSLSSNWQRNPFVPLTPAPSSTLKNQAGSAAGAKQPKQFFDQENSHAETRVTTHSIRGVTAVTPEPAPPVVLYAPLVDRALTTPYAPANSSIPYVPIQPVCRT